MGQNIEENMKEEQEERKKTEKNRMTTNLVQLASV